MSTNHVTCHICDYCHVIAFFDVFGHFCSCLTIPVLATCTEYCSSLYTTLLSHSIILPYIIEHPMAWATAEIQKILKGHYGKYVATTKNEVKQKLRAESIKELHQLHKDKKKANKMPISLPDDDRVLDKVCSLLKSL